MNPFFRALDLSKSFPGVKANDRISFVMRTGEVHALLGENGSGKSTLVKTIYGLGKPDSGKMWLHGEPYIPNSPQDARSNGIAMVFQHFSLFEALTVLENVALGMDQPPAKQIVSELIKEKGRQYGLSLHPNRLVGDLSVGERQRVEIIRCLLQNPELLIMDEPTSVLSPQEVNTLFATLRLLAKEGTSILYISHKLEEIRELCDRATILRAGKVVAECNPREFTSRQLAERMVGRSFSSPVSRGHTVGETPLLEVRQMSASAQTDFGVDLSDISFAVYPGQILGIAGVAGNGQEELVNTLSGEITAAGEILLEGHDLSGSRPNHRRRLGLLTAPEERLGHAAAPDMSLTENAYLTAAIRMRLSPNGFVKWNAAREFTENVVDEFNVKTAGVGNAARALSGGNLQKFLIGREILQKPRALVVHQPTWGVDAAAAAAIRQTLLDLAADGAAAVVISEDLDELFEISTQIAVLNRGRISASQDNGKVSREEIGLLMGADAQAQPTMESNAAH